MDTTYNTIGQFYATAQKNEFARQFQFKITSLGPFTEDDLIYIETATLPTKEVTNRAVPYMGLDFNIPGAVKYTGSDNWKVTFRCDEGHNIRNKMEAYMSEIFDIQTSTGKYGVPTEIATMELLGKQLNPLRKYQFVGIYPRIVGELQYNIENAGDILKLDATFAYQYWQPVG